MPRLLLLVLLVALTAPALAAAASPLDLLTPNTPLPPTAPDADFNLPGQSSSWIVTALHMRGPEKVIGGAVVLLLLVSLGMFAAMLRQVYGGTPPPRR